MPDLMPTIFLGHGNPMNAVLNNVYTDGWKAIGTSIPLPVLSLPSQPTCTFRAAG